MTPLTHKRESIYDLNREDEVFVGSTAYRVKGFARGGMGFILFLERTATWDPQFSVHGPRLAIKAILAGSTDLARMFRRELTVWAGFRHWNILTLNEILDADQSWVAAMDWGEGSLRTYLNSRGSLPEKAATRIILDLIDALDYAYAKDHVHHLDLKPENVIFTHQFSPEGRFMLSDWGIASIKNEALRRIVDNEALDQQNQTLNNVGTIFYMAPERFRSGCLSSIASDIFSLGMMYFELLTGSLPFDRTIEGIGQLLSHAYIHRIEQISADAGLSRAAKELILSSVCPDPSHRISSYSELRSRLVRRIGATLPFLSRIFGN